MQINNTIRVKVTPIVLFIISLVSLPVIGQVTIGSSTKPVSGAILQLKEQEVPNGEANSTRGLYSLAFY